MHNWYRPVTLFNYGRPVPNIRTVHNCTTGTGRSLHITMVGRYQIYVLSIIAQLVLSIIAQLVLAGHSVLLWSAGTGYTNWYQPVTLYYYSRPVPDIRTIHNCTTGIGRSLHITMVGQYQIYVLSIIAQLVPASHSVLLRPAGTKYTYCP